jgi:hypothetical protein
MTDSQKTDKTKKRDITKMAANRNNVTTGIHTTTNVNRKRTTVLATFTTNAMAAGHPKKVQCLSATTQN